MHGLLGPPPWQRTFPTLLPMFALDRVWVRPHSALVDLRAHRRKPARMASDHYPLKAVIAMPEPPDRRIQQARGDRRRGEDRYASEPAVREV